MRKFCKNISDKENSESTIAEPIAGDLLRAGHAGLLSYIAGRSGADALPSLSILFA